MLPGMSFRVTTSALRSAQSTLQALADDTAAARTYTSTYLNITGADNGVLFAHVDNVNASVVQRLDDLCTNLRALLANSGLELAATAKRYDETDLDVAQRHDAQLPLVAAVRPSDRLDHQPDVPDTVPEDPGDYEPPASHDVPDDDDEMIMAPGPIGEPGLPDPMGGTVA
jgi:hypothetical protein